MHGGSDPRGPRGRDRRRAFGGYLRYLHLGTQMVLCLGLGLFGGYWLDGKLGWSPWLTVAGALAGVGIGMGVVIREVGRERR